MKERRIALVTEAGNGLGLRFATILENQGLNVILAVDKNSYVGLEKSNLKDIKLLEIDVTRTEDITKLYNYIETVFGKLDVLVNNTEIANGFGQKLTEIDIEQVNEVYHQNFFSVLQLTQKMYPLLLKSSSASVINISSALGQIEEMKDDSFHYANYQMTGYATAKAALEMLTVLLAKEFKATNINIASFDPIRLKNCTHNDVVICDGVAQDFLKLIDQK